MLTHMHGVADGLNEHNLSDEGKLWYRGVIKLYGAAGKNERSRAIVARVTHDDPVLGGKGI